MSGVHKFDSVSLAELVSRGLKPDGENRPSDSTSQPKKRDRPVVLVVDDEKMIADTLAMILTHEGYVAQSVYSGDDALELATAITPDLVITDVMMPGISGIQLGIRVKRALPNCKVLLFSGHANTLHEQLEEVRKRGYDFTLLAKPLAPTVLLDEIAKLGVPPEEAA